MERRRQSLSSKPSKASLPNSASTSQLSSLGAGDGISGSSTVRSASPQPQMVQEGGAGSNSSEPITMGQIVCLLCDASTLQEKVSGMRLSLFTPPSFSVTCVGARWCQHFTWSKQHLNTGLYTNAWSEKCLVSVRLFQHQAVSREALAGTKIPRWSWREGVLYPTLCWHHWNSSVFRWAAAWAYVTLSLMAVEDKVTRQDPQNNSCD